MMVCAPASIPLRRAGTASSRIPRIRNRFRGLAPLPLRRLQKVVHAGSTTGKSLRWPCAEQAAQHDQLTDVIRRVVRDEQYFTQARLAISIRHASREIGFLVDGQRGQVSAIATKSGDALVPGLGRPAPLRLANKLSATPSPRS